MKHKLFAIVVILAVVLSVWGTLPAQVAHALVCGTNTYMYRSAATGIWAANATWQVSTDGGTTWAAAGCWPSSNNGTIQIKNGHTITVNANITVDQVTIDTGGQVTINSAVTWTIANGTGTDLTVNGTVVNAGTMTMTGTGSFGAGSTYRHSRNGGTIPTATWNAASTVEVTSVTNTAPGGLGQTFGNFTWNSTGQTGANLNISALTTVNGTFTLASTGTGSVRFSRNGATALGAANFTMTSGTLNGSTGSGALTLTISGNYSQSGGTFDLGTGSGGTTINLAGNFSQTAGTLTESGTGTTSGFTFNGTSIQTFTSGGTVSNVVNFTVNANAILYLGTSTMTGDGTFTLNNGGTLGIGDPNGITTVGTASGNIQTTGSRSYGTGATYNYNGTAAQVTGSGLPSNAATTLRVNNAAGVTLSAARTVGTLTIGDVTANSVFNDGGFQLTSTGTFNLTSGTFRLGSATTATTFPAFGTCNISAGTTVEYAAGVAQTVSATPGYSNLTFSGAGTKTLGGVVTVAGNVTILAGALATNNFNMSVAGNWTNSGTFTAGTGTVTFNGAGMQNLTANTATAFNNLTVNSGVILVESVAADNAIVAGTLTNNGTIRKTESVTATGSKTFGLAGAYNGGSLSINVTTQGGMSSLQVDRIDSNHPNATGTPGNGTSMGRWWDITQTGGSGYAVDLTLPHNVSPDTNAFVCEYTAGPGYGWDCARTSSTSNTVTRQNVTALSPWAVGNNTGPTAVTLQSLSAQANVNWLVLAALLSLALLILGGSLLLLRRRA